MLLVRMAVGGNMKGQATLAVAPCALAVLISARARRSSWTGSQRLILHLVLGALVILIWAGTFTQPREEVQPFNEPAAAWTRPSRCAAEVACLP